MLERQEVPMSIHAKVHRTLYVASTGDCDPEAEQRLLEDLPGIVRVCHDVASCTWEVVFDPEIVSDEELIAAFELDGFEVFGRSATLGAERPRAVAQLG
jgi:hypothetical protein